MFRTPLGNPTGGYKTLCGALGSRLSDVRQWPFHPAVDYEYSNFSLLTSELVSIDYCFLWRLLIMGTQNLNFLDPLCAAVTFYEWNPLLYVWCENRHEEHSLCLALALFATDGFELPAMKSSCLIVHTHPVQTKINWIVLGCSSTPVTVKIRCLISKKRPYIWALLFLLWHINENKGCSTMVTSFLTWKMVKTP